MFPNSLFLFYSICFIAFGHFVYLYYIISVIRIIPFSSGSLSTLWSYCTAWDSPFLDRWDFRIKEKTRELSAYIRKVLWSYVVEVVMTRVLRSWMGRPSFLQMYILISTLGLIYVSMPWKGRPSFLHLPLGTRINKGFANPFLQVFSRIFWKRHFWRSFLACSQFVHIRPVSNCFQV